MATAKDYQIKGADKQKETFRRKVLDALPVLRARWAAELEGDRKGVTIDDVADEAKVTKKTLEKAYHSDTLKVVEKFLLTVGGASKKPAPKPRKKSSSIFQQNSRLAQEVEAIRYAKDQVIRAQQLEIETLKASLAAVSVQRNLSKVDGGRPASRRAA